MSAHIQPYLSGLNQQQQKSVSLPVNVGPVMVLAGAGTGKTSVLTKRIAYLCANGVDAHGILAVTFTNKAAKEMRERLKRMHVPPHVTLGTFHSIGLKVLKRCPQAAGVRPGFTVMDEDDTKRLWRSLFIAADDEAIAAGSVKMHRWDQDIKKFMTQMFAEKDKGVRVADPNPASPMEQSIGKMLTIYEAERKKLNLVDFSDLISASLEAIQHHPEGMMWAAGFTHVLVDEFQDTSKLQFKWVTSVLGGVKSGQQIFAVGDDSQSIYSFRGANIENISRFVTDYNATEIMLEQNYRCGSDILQAANNLIARNVNGDRKKLWTENATGQVHLSNFPSDKQEAAAIAAELARCQTLSECAILVRTRGAMVPIAQALRLEGVDHHIVGAMDFFDAKEIKDAMSLIRFAVNHQDSMSFGRMAGIFSGVGKKTILGALDDASRSLMPILGVCSQNKKLVHIYEAFRDIDGESNAVEATHHLVDVSGLLKECEKSDEAVRLSNIKEFIELAGQFETLTEFLEEMTLFADKENRQTGVTISTIHAAKGLEWNRVYLPVLTEFHLPITREFGIDTESKHLEFMSREEERRLMYVAITRAKDELFISYPYSRMVNGQHESTAPSRFLKEAGQNG